MMMRIVSSLSLFLFVSPLFAAPAHMVIEGKLIDSSNVPVESSSVNIWLEVLSPAPTECVLYMEQHTLNMQGSNGNFSLELGAGSQSGGDYEDVNTMADAFDNNLGLVTPTNCISGPNYTPAAADHRNIRISFDHGSGVETVSGLMKVGSSAYALSAGSIDGMTSADLLTIDTSGSNVLTQANLVWAFDSTRFAELQALINGTSTQYLDSTPTADFSMSSNKITDVAVPTNPNDAANKTYVDSNLGGVAVDSADLGALAPGNAGEVLTWDGTQWVSQVSAGDSTKLPLAGGTMTGALNMGSQDITSVNNITGIGSLSIAGISTSGNLQIYNGANFMGFNAPAGAGDLIWTLPATDGTNGQVLSTNGAGVLSWANSSAPVADVFGRTGSVVAQAGDYNANQITNTPSGNIAAVDVQAAINEIDTEKLATAGDNMTGSLTMDSENEIRFSDNDNSHYVGFKAPTNITAGASFVWELPPDDGTNGQVLQTNGSGILSWVSAGASGEINTASNQGAGGVGVFDTKNGLDLEFKNINSGSEGIAIANDVVNSEVDISLDLPGITDLGAAADNADSLIVYDASATALREVTRAQLVLSEAEVDAYTSNNGYGDVLTGGNTDGAAVTIGTNDNFDLHFETNGTTGMSLKNNGWLGVGLTTPNSTLEVAGDIQIGNESAACVGAKAGAMRYNTGNVEFCNGTAWTAFVSGGAGDMLADGSVAFTGDVEFADGAAGAPGIRFDSDTDTGIYRPNPDEVGVSVGGVEMLHIDGSGADIHQDLEVKYDGGTANLKLDSYSATGMGSKIKGSYARNTAASPSAVQMGDQLLSLSSEGYGATAPGAGARIDFYASENWSDVAHGSGISFKTIVDGNTGAPTEHMRLTGTGFLGLGENAPNARIDVRQFGGEDFFRARNNAGSVTHMILDSTGRLGLGQASPTDKLHISNGAIRITGTHTCGAGNINTISVDGGGKPSVCKYDGTNYTWQPLGKEPCPSSMELVGNIGERGSFCADTTTTSGSYNNAVTDCSQRSNIVAHICTVSELQSFNEKSGGLGSPHISSDFVNGTSVMSVTGTGTPNGGVAFATGGQNYRCCAD